VRGKRPLLALASLVVLALFLEAGMRVAAAVAARVARRDAGGTGPRRILCIGDSNTYGFGVAAEEAYPARLEAILNARGGARWSVVNAGVPGRPSGEALMDLESRAPALSPAVVVALVGWNDVWRDAEGPLGRFLDSLRLVRFGRLLLARLGPTVERAHEEGREGGLAWMRNREGRVVPVGLGRRPTPLAEDRLREHLGSNLGRIARAARASGAIPLLLTYGLEGESLAGVNRAIRAFAASSGEAVLDLAEEAAALDRRGWTTFFYFQDLHPQPRGHEWMARLVANALVRLGALEGESIPDPLRGLEPESALPEAALTRDRSRPAIRLVGNEAEGFALEIEDAPRLHYHVLLSAADRPPWEGRPFDRRAVQSDPVLVSALSCRDLGGSFDEAGRARIPLSPLLRGGSPPPKGIALRVAYLIRAFEADPWIRDVSGTVVIRLPD